jgi:hypothetical protein
MSWYSCLKGNAARGRAAISGGLFCTRARKQLYGPMKQQQVLIPKPTNVWDDGIYQFFYNYFIIFLEFYIPSSNSTQTTSHLAENTLQL